MQTKDDGSGAPARAQALFRLRHPPSEGLARRLLGAATATATTAPATAELAALPYSVLDLETTGTNPGFSEILEVGVCEVEGGRVVREWSTLVRPGRTIPPAVTALTGIDEEMVRDAPVLDDILEPLLERLRGRVLVAHNAAFDLRFLDQALEARARPAWGGPVICTRRLARRLRSDLQRFSLDDLCAAYDIPNRARHRAAGDAEATARLLVELLALAQRQGATTLGALHDLLHRPPSPQVDFDRYAFGPAFLAHLPARPGIYRMLDRAGAVLYVGKARDLRARVGSYFVGRARGRVAALREALYDIEVVPTDSEIEALLRESAEIRAARPPFNVQVQVHRRAFYLKVSRRGGRARVVAARSPAGDGPHYGPFIDPIGPRHAAKLLRAALDTAEARLGHPIDPEPLLSRGEGSSAVLGALEEVLAHHQRRGDRAGAEETRRAIGVVARAAATAAGPRGAFHRRDLVLRLPAPGRAKLFVLREGAPLELLEVGEPDGDLEAIAARVETLLAQPAPAPEPGADDGLKILDAWLARNRSEACLDLGDVVDGRDLRARLRALLR